MVTIANGGASSGIGDALVDFSVSGLFPEEHVSSLKLSPDELPAAIKAVAEARVKLQVRYSISSLQKPLINIPL